VDQQNHYVGVVTIEGLFNFTADNNAVTEPGGILVLEMEQRNYSLSEISRICESNDISILCLFVKTKDESGMQHVTLKVNKTDVQSLVATFERFSYNIVETYAIENHKEDLRSNYNQLMHFINI
jgi:hypothetical protein